MLIGELTREGSIFVFLLQCTNPRTHARTHAHKRGPRPFVLLQGGARTHTHTSEGAHSLCTDTRTPVGASALARQHRPKASITCTMPSHARAHRGVRAATYTRPRDVNKKYIKKDYKIAHVASHDKARRCAHINVQKKEDGQAASLIACMRVRVRACTHARRGAREGTSVRACMLACMRACSRKFVTPCSDRTAYTLLCLICRNARVRSLLPARRCGHCLSEIAP